MSESEQTLPLFFKRVLLTVDADDTDSTKHAFRFAVTYAKDNGISLGIVSVMEMEDINIYDSLSPDRLQKKREAVEEVVKHYADLAKQYGVKSVKSLIGEGGDVDDVVLDQIIPEFHPDLVVCGADMVDARHKSGKTIGLHLAKRVSTSVIVVR
ncbi:hypothetical protein C5L31_000683 [Secundilactobacillus malefermentans]|uniref:UspA domain-containing protein n=1 Tax=Secundilactobacillus malefermentans TaxID=176292 RepID=A0A4R5NP01_9LACO|nr:universal stress protein [Secundilactobacillus malefermentans]KRM57320.1 hypothetical protein FD44_GL001191 [Secundilactobacillus malefermentans DSM 5705 = KCTC 3548]TDG77247.1 hypothetical protein C5L31_000683 [Secundilactobacillus malefermentans]